MGLNGSMIGSSAAVYPLIGGALAGIRWIVPFLFFGTAILVGVVAVFILDEPQKADPADVGEYLRRIRNVVVLPEAQAIFAVIFVAFFVFYGAVLTAEIH